MKVRISQRDLLIAIQQVHGVVEKRNTMPILTHLLMDAKDGKISLFATDLEVGIQGDYVAEVIEQGTITISARKLHEIVRQFSEGYIDIASQKNYWVGLESGKSLFRIVGLPPEEFPTPPSLDIKTSISIDPVLFNDLIRRTLIATGENDPRYILNGMMIQLEKKSKENDIIRLVATDGNRLAIAEGPITKSVVEEEISVIVPKKAIMEIKRSLDEGSGKGCPELFIGKNQMVYRWGSFVLTTRLMEGEFPDYKQAIPMGNDKIVRVKKDALEGGLRRVSILAREKTSAVRFSLEEGRILLSASNPEMGEANEEILTSFEGEGFTTGFNARYLLDALSVLNHKEAVLEFKNDLSPCLLKEESEGFLSVIMPMRV
ncbi:MAG: DNA polymerase III subunit beta [Nitrospiria bacterium]